MRKTNLRTGYSRKAGYSSRVSADSSKEGLNKPSTKSKGISGTMTVTLWPFSLQFVSQVNHLKPSTKRSMMTMMSMISMMSTIARVARAKPTPSARTTADNLTTNYILRVLSARCEVSLNQTMKETLDTEIEPKIIN